MMSAFLMCYLLKLCRSHELSPLRKLCPKREGSLKPMRADAGVVVCVYELPVAHSHVVCFKPQASIDGID